jgi:predicted MFS family arabinose efflux permease
VKWFNEGRGFALAVALCGTGLSSLVMPTAAAYAIEAIGWRLAYVILAASVVLIALPVTIWVLRPEDEHGPSTPTAAAEDMHGLTLAEALKGVRFWMLTLSLMMVGFAVSGLIPNIVPMMTGRGLEATTAATLMGVLGLSIIVGRLATGAAVDRFWAPFVALALLPMPAISCIILESGVSDYMAIAACVVLIGIATGAEFDLAPYLVTRYFGTRSYSQIYAIQWIGFTVAAGSAPVLYGYLFDLTGNYSLPLYVSAGLFLLSPVVLLGLGRYPMFGSAKPLTDGALSRAAT